MLCVGHESGTLREREKQRERQCYLFFQYDFYCYLVRLSASSHYHTILCAVSSQITVDGFRDQSNRDRDDPLGDRIKDLGGNYRPTLGPAWHHCVSTRITMHMARAQDWPGVGEFQGQVQGPGGEQAVRVVSLTKSPIAGPCQIPFEITASGVRACTVRLNSNNT